MSGTVIPGEARAHVSRPVVFEVLALISAVWIAVALTRDPRATSLHLASLWLVSGVIPVAVLVRFRGSRSAVWRDAFACVATLVGSLGSYTIGGLALLIPASFLGAAAVAHFISSPGGADALRLKTGRPQLIAAAAIGGMGAFLGMSFSPLALLGLLLSVAAIRMFGVSLSASRRRRGKSPGLGWAAAILIVLGMNVFAWVLALSLVVVF